MFPERFTRLDPRAWTLPPEVVERAQSPALVVWLDRVRENLQTVLRRLDGDPGRWRPHVKTAKIPAVMAEMARAGLTAFKCATTREAACVLDVLDAERVAGDLLVAFPLVGPALGRLAGLAAGHPAARVSVLVEDAAGARAVPAGLGVFVDVNVGMDRTGVPAARVGEIVAAARAAGERFRGLHAYDGHVAGPDAAARRRAAFDAYDALPPLVERLRGSGLPVGELVTSGTPSFLAALAYPGFAGLGGTLHRVSPGTVVYHDVRTEHELPELGLAPAALVLARVVSRPAPGVVTCDAGSKAIAAEAGDPVAFVLGRPELEPRRPSEEHLPFDVRGGPAPERGTPLLLVPRHVCPTVNLATEALLIDDGRLVAVAPVAARAHEIGDVFRTPGSGAAF